MPAHDEHRAADLAVGCFRLWVSGRAFDQAQDFWDGNWLQVEAEACAAGAVVRASGTLVHLGELERFGAECRRLHATLAGEAALACLEPNLRVSLKSSGLGHLHSEVSITPDHMTQRHTFFEELDQTYLPAICQTIEDVLRRWPIRGRPSAGA